MTKSRFKATYSAADGYVGKASPLYFSISSEDLEEDMDDNALVEFFEQSMQDHFEQTVYPESNDRHAFLLWAYQQLKNREEMSNDD